MIPTSPTHIDRAAPVRRVRLGIVVFGLVLLLPSILHAQARTVRNGGFEQPVISSDWDGVADSAVPGWTSPDGVIEIWQSGFQGVASVSGGQHAEANANSPSGFWQDVCLVAGESVPWSFHHRGRSGLDSMRVTFDGTEIARVGTDPTDWVRYSGTFVATDDGPARVRFEPLNSGSVGNFVDDVAFALDPHVEVGPDATVDEASGGVTRLFVSGTLAAAQTVDVVITGGSAQAGSDYAVTTTVTIPAGRYDGTTASAVSVPLGIQDDGVAEGDETLVYELTNPSGNLRLAAARAAACGSPARSAATITIVDDDEVDLAIRKLGPTAGVPVDTDVAYELRVDNAGPDDAIGVVVTDTLPAGATFVSATRGATESGGVVTWPALDLANGAQQFDSVVVRFGSTGRYDQIASVASISPDRNAADNRDALEVEVGDAGTPVVEVDLRIEKSGPGGTVPVDRDLTYELRTRNEGPDAATGVVVTDTLPAGATFVTATRGAAESGGVVTWPAVDLADGAELFDSITVRFGVTGAQDQIAAVVSDAPDQDPTDNRDAVAVDVRDVEVDLEVVKSGPDEDVQAGVDVTYEIETKNDGPDDAAAVVVTDTLPPGAVFVSATRGATESGGVVTWPAIDLADGAELLDSITFQFGAGGEQDQIAAAVSAAPDRDMRDNRDVIEVEVCGFAVTTVSTMAQLRAATEDECVETILLEPGTYLLTSSGSGELRIESDKQYLNAGGGTVVIDGGGASRVFRIDDNTVTLFDGLEVVGGAETGGQDGGGFRTRGDVTIRNTLITGNRVEDRGGGLYQDNGSLLLENVTVTGNSSGDRGGGLSVRSNAVLRHVTVAGNRSGDNGSGISREGGGQGPLLENVLVADNVGPGGQIRRAIRPSGVNLVEGGCNGCRAGIDLTGDPNLSALAQNGGPTRTMALPTGSIARNAAPDVLAADQRGITRPQGAASDIGAFEAVEIPPEVVVSADVGAVSRLPSNGVDYRETFEVLNDGGNSAVYDLLVTASAPTVAIDSIRGPGLGFDGSRPDSARTASLAAGASVSVSVWYRVGDVALGESSPVELEATDVSAPSVSDRATTTVTVSRPRLGLSKTAAVAGDTLPGSLVTYEMTVTNNGTDGADLVVLSDSIPAELDFQLGSTAETLPGGITATVEFATSPGAWGYTPVSGACGAAPGFDACVRFLRWTLSDTLPATPGMNVGEFVFTSIIR